MAGGPELAKRVDHVRRVMKDREGATADEFVRRKVALRNDVAVLFFPTFVTTPCTELCHRFRITCASPTLVRTQESTPRSGWTSPRFRTGTTGVATLTKC